LGKFDQTWAKLISCILRNIRSPTANNVWKLWINAVTTDYCWKIDSELPASAYRVLLFGHFSKTSTIMEIWKAKNNLFVTGSFSEMMDGCNSALNLRLRYDPNRTEATIMLFFSESTVSIFFTMNKRLQRPVMKHLIYCYIRLYNKVKMTQQSDLFKIKNLNSSSVF